MDFIEQLHVFRKSNDDLTRFLRDTKGFYPGTAVDVGVAFGTPELYRIFPKSFLAMIEPVAEFEPYMVNLCKELPHARYWIGGAGDCDGEMTIHVTPDLTTTSRLRPMNATPDVSLRTVPSFRLDSLDKGEWPGPILLKIDVQGYELKVLDGAPKLLDRTEVVLLEVSLFPFAPDLPDFHDVVSYMKKRGFVAYDLYCGHNRPLDGARAQIDIAFVKEHGFLRNDLRWGTPEQCNDFLSCKFNREIYQNINPDFAHKHSKRDSSPP